MSEQGPRRDVEDLMVKYLSGNASEAEVQRLESWVLENPTHKEQFMAFKKLWFLASLSETASSSTVDKAWTAVSDQISASDNVVHLNVRRSSSRLVWWSVAAACLVLVIGLLWVFLPSSPNQPLVVTALDKIIEQELPDGSQVSINRYSEITYLLNTRANRRELSLEGDAFFEIARDTSLPFVISTEEVEIEVLGTSFYVDAREGEPEIQVLVQSGTVALRHRGQEIMLTENEVGTLDRKTGDLKESQNNDVNYLGWIQNELIFESNTLEQIVFAVNRHYHSSITIEDNAIKDCKLTATYRDKSLDAVIRIIETSLNIQSRKEGEKIFLSGSGCN